MPKQISASSQYLKEQAEIKKSEQKLAKIEEKEALRLMGIFRSEGYFEVDISDDVFRSFIREQVKSAKNPKVSSTPPTLVRKVATGS